MIPNQYRKVFYLSIITVLLSISFWFAFYLNIPQKLGFPATTLETIYANYDGPNYMVISKCGYTKNCIATQFSLPLPLEYYPAHFPGYPFLIRFISQFVITPKAMLLATLIGSVLLTVVTYLFLSRYLKENTAFYLTLLSLVFPGRLLILRLIGAPETWFMALTLLSIMLFQQRRFLASGIAAALTVTFKSPSVLLFSAYLCIALFDLIKYKNFKQVLNKYISFTIGPILMLLIFYSYYLQTGDFFAYFHSGDNFHLNLLPYMVFVSNHTWINTIWLEDVLYIYLFAFIALAKLYKKYKFNLLFIYPFLFTLATVFVAHRDISRYIAPVYPFLILGFSKFLAKKNIRLIFLLLVPAVLLYAVNFLIGNAAPIADWTPYL